MRKRATIKVDGRVYADVASTPEATCFVPWRSPRGAKMLLGFSKTRDFRTWAEEHGFGEAVDCVLQRLARVRASYSRKPSKSQQAKLRAMQVQRLRLARGRVLAVLRRLGAGPRDPESLAKLARDYDPIEGPPFASCFLFRYTGYAGSYVYLPSGFAYPAFSWFGFDNRASSAIELGVTTVLFQYSWFGGRTLWLIGVFSSDDLADFDFDNRTSSAIVE